jgi:UV DNA damage repair endonuclease
MGNSHSNLLDVKLSSAVVAILVGGMKCRTQFWKGTTQGSFQQSLVEIGSVVSEKNIFFKFHPPYFAPTAELSLT